VFDRILDWLDRGWALLKPFFVVDCFEKAGVLRFGKYHRSAMPGFHWKIPLIEKVMEVTAVETTWHSPAQPLTTKDDVAVTVTTVVRYEVEDPKAYITNHLRPEGRAGGPHDGRGAPPGRRKTYRELVDAEEPEKEIATLVKRAVHKYGFLIHEVTFTAFTKARPIMLISQSVLQNLDN
jgi:hypothetical protein